jgi:hypothetical protein
VTTAQEYPPAVRQAIDDNERALSRLRQRWTENDWFGSPGNKRSVYYDLPFLLAGAFAGVDFAQIQVLGQVARLLAQAVIDFDKVLDEGGLGMSHRGGHVMAGQAAQFEAFHLLYGLFPVDSAFWSAYRRHASRYAHACILELEHRERRGGAGALSMAQAIALAVEKNALAQIIPEALGLLSSDTAGAERMRASLELFTLAVQALDDLKDWSEDVRTHSPSLVVAGLAEAGLQAGASADVDAELAATRRAVYAGGIGQRTCEIAIASLADAIALASSQPDSLWLERLRLVESRTQSVLGMFAGTRS